MADLTLDILTDKTKYPDTAEITLADGQKITVKEFRDKLQPRAEFTRASEAWAQKEQQYKQGLDAASQNLAQALREKEAAILAGKEPPKGPSAGTITEEELLADPILGPLVKEVKEARAELKAVKERITRDENTYTRTRFIGQISELKKRDKDLDVDKFLEYTQKRPVIDVESQMVDLDETYKNFAHDRLVTAARAEGEAEGVKKGTAAARVPAIPFGRRRAPVKPEGLPETLQQLTDDQVLNDPEMQEAARGEEPQ